MQSGWQYLLISSAITGLLALAGAAHAESLQVYPEKVLLVGPESTQQVLLISRSENRHSDLTQQAEYVPKDNRIISVTQSGRIVPHAEGTTSLEIRIQETSLYVPVTVTGLLTPAPVSFQDQILPILTKAGCNSGGCHGKAEGQNGFKLSIFGFDADADYDAIVKEGRGRRISRASPAHSVLLRKATGKLPHGGGRKILQGSLWYQMIQRWIAEGAQIDNATPTTIRAISVEPKSARMHPLSSQQLQVTAILSDGTRRCITTEAEYGSNASTIAEVNTDGQVQVSDIPGEAAILIRYMGHVSVSRITSPQTPSPFTRLQDSSAIDHTVWDKLEQLGIAPSDRIDDATFLRRIFLDTIGTLPTTHEVRRFLKDPHPEKRSHSIDQLLAREEYADYWAMKWADILRVDKNIVKPQGTVAMTRWLRKQMKNNTPYDRFVRSIITAKGNTFDEGPAAFFQVHQNPEMLARSVSQLFLGIRLECAQCHHHPFEKWSQADYFGFAGFFTGVGRKTGAWGGQTIFRQTASNLKHPRTQQPVPIAGLDGPPLRSEHTSDRLSVLADWIISRNNPFTARMITNRLWAHYFGRGIVEPIDDMRMTNPASNEPLLQLLEKSLLESNYDLKAFTRLLLNSHTYQISSHSNGSNERDEQNFSHASWKPLPAEVLLDAICQVTGVSEHFNGWPDGYRAIQIWDNRMPSYFFRIFGKPQRVSVCECERGTEPSVAQALHLMNSPESVRKIRDRNGRAAKLSRSELSDSEIIEELYLAALSRYPSLKETDFMLQAFDHPGSTRRTASEDILWTLLNTKEFLYNH